MLTENEIVKKVSSFLEKDGYKIIQSLKTTERGIDIIAKRGNVKIYIEAKGETSSKPNSNRYGIGFSNNQIKTHIARAIYSCMKVFNSYPNGDETSIGIALPDTSKHRMLIKEVELALQNLSILVFWVSRDALIVELNEKV